VNRHVLALAVLLVCALVGNLVSLDIARNARGRLALMTSSPVEERIVPGETAPPLKAKTLDGRDVTMATKDTPLPTVVYVFSPTCGWCKRNHSSVEALIKAAGARYRFVSVSMQRQDLSDYLAERPTAAQVFMEPSSDTVKTYGLGATPTTIVLNANGVVERVWVGAFTGTTRTEVEELFGVRLPDIPSSSTNPKGE
jgi:hypothetical protein